MLKVGDWVRTLDRKIMFEVCSVGEDYVQMNNLICYPFKDVERIFNPETFAQSNKMPMIDF